MTERNRNITEHDEAGNLIATYVTSGVQQGQAGRVDVVVSDAHFALFAEDANPLRPATGNYQKSMAKIIRCVPAGGLSTQRYRGLHGVCRVKYMFR